MSAYITDGSIGNAKAIEAVENEFFGVAQLAALTIVVEGIQIPHYKHFKLSQSATTHHRFELITDYDALGIAQDHHLEDAQKLLGKRILVTFSYKNIKSDAERDFIGTVTRVGLDRETRNHGELVISGCSPTILLDGAPHLQGFGGDTPISLSIIAQRLFKQGLDSEQYPTSVSGANDSIGFMAQYNETHYNFLNRVAAAYGKQFYYDGTTLRFGQLPPPARAITLTLGRNVGQIDITMKAVHTVPYYYGYNSIHNQALSMGQNGIRHESDLAKDAYRISQKTYRTPSLSVAPMRARTDRDIEISQRSETGSRAVEVLSVSGTTSVPFLYPGCIVDMELLKPGTAVSTYFTRLMITEIHHDVDRLGHYEGRFEAIAEGTGYLPKPEFKIPVAEPQAATVVDNADPLGQGRVKVRFMWQDRGESTEWIRVMAPDAGGGGAVGKNRGHVFIPEVGDQVMTGFIHNHPDRPFVMGGMFHGQVAAGGGANNHIKSITTKSGHTIEFDDAAESQGITIKDISGNVIHIDTKGKNIEITAPETITLNCKNMNINVAENMTTNVGKNATETVGMNKTESVGMFKNLSVGMDFITNVVGSLMEFVKGNKESKAKEIKENSKMRQIVSAENNNIHAQKTFNNNNGKNSKMY